jgi:hypothetical protein
MLSSAAPELEARMAPPLLPPLLVLNRVVDGRVTLFIGDVKPTALEANCIVPGALTATAIEQAIAT